MCTTCWSLKKWMQGIKHWAVSSIRINPPVSLRKSTVVWSPPFCLVICKKMHNIYNLFVSKWEPYAILEYCIKTSSAFGLKFYLFFFQSLINAFDEQLGANKGQRRLKIYSNRCSLPHGGSRPSLIWGKGGSPRSLNNHRPVRLLIPILVIKLTFQTSRLFLSVSPRCETWSRVAESPCSLLV